MFSKAKDSRNGVLILLGDAQGLFNKAVKPEWSELRPNPNVIEFLRVDNEFLMSYMHWVYFRTIPTPSSYDPIPKRGQGDYLRLATLIVMATENEWYLLEKQFKSSARVQPLAHVLGSLWWISRQTSRTPTSHELNNTGSAVESSSSTLWLPCQQFDHSKEQIMEILHRILSRVYLGSRSA
ncbi:hypothetical protein CC78DRAFT_584204 [Lojkania enalia]|uniref:Uncharacterized protein n=1 Tax=Lojkania enalia TaxID=147567 RepID=A0A9P4K2N5_9PLEO|nr:hypothetical protein CC78DRAFT_584204 [Didymosphaeria enalia]